MSSYDKLGYKKKMQEDRFMIQLKSEYYDKLSKWKSQMTDSTCYSIMQGRGGVVWVDNDEEPASAAMIYGDFCFLVGEGIENAEEELLDALNKSGKTWSIFVPETESWINVLEKQTTFTSGERYLIKKKETPFDKELLESYTKQISEEYEIKQIDAQWYQRVIENEWSRDLCGNFATAEDYEKYGLGFIAVCKGEIAAGVSTYASYDKGIEIEIDTKEEHRKQGLATALGATIILECIKRGLYPHWDAANMVSVKTAQKLGYEFNRPYIVYSNVPLHTM